ncbi:MAG: DNA/RNA nuclease SfsA [Clostridia bacterium]|nr:DNA/RNA nuclease SfsA [Clostridia bacterium]
MKYKSIKKAIFIKRPNRFIAQVFSDGREEVVHVKNTGRCKEILKEGAQIILEVSSNPLRKTRCSLISCYKNQNLINIDSQVPNTVVYESILQKNIKEFQNVAKLKREVVYKNSRFDLYFTTDTTEGFIEVKGVTLECDGIASFPDAPTERGTKHIYEMMKAVEEGYEGYIFFLIQMKNVNLFTPNKKMDPAFAQALETAVKRGVRVLAYDAVVTEDEITIGNPIPIDL